MSRFAILKSDVWQDDEFKELSQTGKNLYFYLLSSPIGNSIGYYRLPIGQIVLDTGITEEKILPELLGKTELWKYHEGTKQVLIPGYLKHNRLSSPSQLKGMTVQLSGLKKCRLHADFLYSVYSYCGEGALAYISDDILECVRVIVRDSDRPEHILLNTVLSNI